MDGDLRWLWLIIVVMCGALFFIFWPRTPAYPHDAPSGWTYPYQCCSGYDCRQVKASTVKTSRQGYVLQPSGETVGYADERVKPSPDDDYHWCSVGGRDDGRTICLFVPPQAF